MTSFRLSVTPHRRAAARFIDNVHRRLLKAYADSPDVTQTAIANTLGVHRSVINRQMRGRKDMSLGRVAELAHLLGYEAEFEMTKPNLPDGSNAPQGNVGINPFNQTQAFLDANKPIASAASRFSEYKLELAS